MNKSDIKIIELIEILKSLGMVKDLSDFCDGMYLVRQNVYRIKNGLAHFTVQHVDEICKKYNVNANWIFGTQENIFNHPERSLKRVV